MREPEAVLRPRADRAPLPRLTLVLGGARSGKSRHAEELATASAACAVYLATAQAHDSEMADRIARHRARRATEHSSREWLTVEEPLGLAERLADLARPDRPILVDCLTLWLSNLMLAGSDVAAAIDGLVDTLPTLAGPAIFVANEVGLGIVPDNALARTFRDHAGTLNQAVAAVADRVVFMAAGLPLVMKETPPSLALPRKGGEDSNLATLGAHEPQ